MSMSSYPVFQPNPCDKCTIEKGKLRHDAMYVGTLTLVLTFVFQYAYSFFVKLMINSGIITAEDTAQYFLGMDNTTYLLFYSFVYAFSLFVPAVVVSFLFKKRSIPFGLAKPVPFGFAFLSIIGAVGACMIANILGSVIVEFFEEMGASGQPAPSLMINTPASYLLNLFTIAVLPALLEEMVYRGYILQTLRSYGSLYAVVISSLLFSLMHLNLDQIPFAFIVGLFLGFICIQTNNIWIPITIHFINNALSVTMQYLSFSLTEDQTNQLYQSIVFTLIRLGVIASVILLIVYRSRLRLPRQLSSLSFWKRIGITFAAPLFLTAMLVYMFFLFMGM